MNLLFPPPYQVKDPLSDEGDRAVEERAEAQVKLRRFRVFLHGPEGQFHDLNIVSWPDFIQQMIVCHGLLLEHAWIPEHMIKLIVEVVNTQPVEAKYSGNVVELRKP